MSEPAVDSERAVQRRGGGLPVRAAALGLLALAAIIVLVSLFGKDDDGSGAPDDESTSSETTTTESGSESSAPESSTSVHPSQESSGSASVTDATVAPEPTPEGVTVLITSQTWNAETESIEVVGTVQGIATETSTCTATATSGGSTATAAVDGAFDGSGTSCGLISISMTDQPAGEYQIVLEFSSASGSGTSEPVTVTVP